ncbi:uncharacterized protein K02A2.6-like [Galleria mellonella]|uniref:RNA-directed DNA polymerase n=1 Tax=Galleria mellonella TaxID=7137 RepID=A0ABM3N2H4_GALME|nr:uncharacterized protein K02A2.6-like [Galleria mellonella]
MRLKIKKQKCNFFSKEIKYLGYIINKEGVRADPEKINPILKMRAPANVSELKSFLGMINFYGKFIKNLSSYLSSMYVLLKKNNKKWVWLKCHQSAFERVKCLLSSSEVLAHYDASLPVMVTCDASAHGIGAVLSQSVPGGGGSGAERVVAYASRALTPAERNYSQIHKEALAIVFAVKKYHQYLYGRQFVLRTDHKPLVSIFGPRSGIPNMTASRLQRWALILSAYDFKIEYVSSENNTADALSRLIAAYKAEGEREEDSPEQTYLHFAADAFLLDYNDVRKETKRDPLLSRVLRHIREGWPTNNEIKELQPFFNRRNELYTELDCIMWGHRVVVPYKLQTSVLQELHETHMGIVKTKSVARSYVWWPGVDEAVERQCAACATCAQVADAPRAHQTRSWPWPNKPWSRIHLDFLGPMGGVKYLVIVDACSKWVEAIKMKSTTASQVIYKLRDLFSRYGIPKQIVSDNGPPFSSEELMHFCKFNGIEHLFSAAYHPASNGAAENAVKLCKKVIKKAILQKVEPETALNRFLLMYRNTIHNTTGDSPAQLFLGRSIRTRLDCLRPDREKHVSTAQRKQELAARGTQRYFEVGDRVWYRQFGTKTKWGEGIILEKLGSTDYNIKTKDKSIKHRHIDQLKRHDIDTQTNGNTERKDSWLCPELLSLPIPGESEGSEGSRVPLAGRAASPAEWGSARERRLPVRYGLDEYVTIWNQT